MDWAKLMIICFIAFLTACGGGSSDSGGGDSFDSDQQPASDSEERPEPDSEEQPTPGDTEDPAAFSGFKDLDFKVGSYFDYSFSHISYTNDELNEELSGVVRVEFVDSVDISLDGVGTVTFFKTNYSTLSGDTPPYGFPWYPYIGEEDGVIYIGEYKSDSQFAAATLFDANEGSIYDQGFMGYFSASTEETIFSGKLDNEFINASAVVVSEEFYDPECEMIAGTEVCDDEFYNYEIREYYLPHVGFGGFYRSGTSIFSGGGYTSIHESTYHVGITGTNVHDLSTLP